MLDERATALAALQATREKARGLEITRIVRALEGVETHDAVTQVENTRHWPVVIAALEAALRDQPATLALSADDDGATPLDGALLAVVNAIPAEGRMVIEAQQPTSAKEHEDPTLNKPRQFTDEEIKEYAKSLHPPRGAR
jgi:citrate lyase beta subunit